MMDETPVFFFHVVFQRSCFTSKAETCEIEKEKKKTENALGCDGAEEKKTLVERCRMSFKATRVFNLRVSLLAF